jgi:hypothetical protein
MNDADHGAADRLLEFRHRRVINAASCKFQGES